MSQRQCAKDAQGRHAIQYCKSSENYGGDSEHNGREIWPRVSSCYGEVQVELHVFADREVGY